MHIRLNAQLIDAVHSRSLILATTQIALFGINTQTCNDNVLEAIAHRALASIDDLRLKDMERITHAFNLYGYDPASGIKQKLYKAILQQLEHHRNTEAIRHPARFIRCVRNLAIAGVHSDCVTSKVLENANNNDISDNSKGYDYLLLDSYVKLNLKGTKRVHQLTENQCVQLMQGACATDDPLATDGDAVSKADKVRASIWKCAKKTYGHCDWAHALPHIHRPGIFLALNTRVMRSVNISHRYPPRHAGKFLHKDQLTDANTQIEVVTFLLATYQCYAFHTDGQRLKTSFTFVANQLKLLGYRPIVVGFSIYLTHKVFGLVSYLCVSLILLLSLSIDSLL